jgi:hypothetical protein
MLMNIDRNFRKVSFEQHFIFVPNPLIEEVHDPPAGGMVLHPTGLSVLKFRQKKGAFPREVEYSQRSKLGEGLLKLGSTWSHFIGLLETESAHLNILY